MFSFVCCVGSIMLLSTIWFLCVLFCLIYYVSVCHMILLCSHNRSTWHHIHKLCITEMFSFVCCVWSIMISGSFAERDLQLKASYGSSPPCIIESHHSIYARIKHVCDTTHTFDTRWRRPIGCLKLQVISCKGATNLRALLRKMTYKDKASYGSLPPCITKRTVSQGCNSYGVATMSRRHKIIDLFCRI